MSERSTAAHDLAAIAALTLLLTSGLSRAGAEPPSYHATLLDDMVETVFPGVDFPSSRARGLNENGDLIGEAKLNWDPVEGEKMQAFVYTVEHGVTPLPLLPGWSSNAVRDVSERDENGEIIIVGGAVPGPSIVIGQAALWRFSTATGEVLESSFIPIFPGFDDSVAVAVNNDGTVVGFSSLIGPYTNWKYNIATDTLETFEFPCRVRDLNNVGQVCGGVYRGDLFGNWEDLSETYEPGDVMPDWAIDNGDISAEWSKISDQGWLVGLADTEINDGAGHHLVAVVRYADPIGWVGFTPCCWLDYGPGGINDLGDFTNASGELYLEDMSQAYVASELLAPEWQQQVLLDHSLEINNNRQIAGAQGHVVLLTPLGEMIIPGDVNGDASVDLDDYCAWVTAPLDLDGDGDVDADDEQWLVNRLLVFGQTVEDCNGNGVADHCDIVDGTSLDCDLDDVPDECQPDCNGDGVPDTCEADCNGNGIPDPCDIADGTSEDCNGNGIPDECDGGGVTEVSIAHDPPHAMYPNAVIVEDVLVTDDGIVEDVNLFLDYRYRIGHTTVELSHNGTTVTILDRPGYPQYLFGFVNFGYDAIVDDEGTGPYLETIGDFCCSFETILSPPSYRPNSVGSPGLDVFDGMPVEGIWTFTMTTTPDVSSGDGLHGWGLTITRAAVPVGTCDCNDNGIADDVDIANGTSIDGNGNGVPDECEGTPGDANGDGRVDVDDLVMVILGWGPCPAPPAGCAADVDGSGVVDVDDLVMVLLNWS